jgi:AcrR family transcriptional regulator
MASVGNGSHAGEAHVDGPYAHEQLAPEGRRRTRRPLIVRDDVTGAALALLDEGGYAHLSMRNLCTRLGVSLPTVYTAAQSKESVVELAGGRGLDRWVNSFAGGTIEVAAAAMADRPWLFDLVRLEPRLARAALEQLSDEAVGAAAALGPPGSHPERSSRSVQLDAAMLVWMALELSHRLVATGVIRGTASGGGSIGDDGTAVGGGGADQTAPMAASVLAALAPWASAG